jgi:hypothetical protein
MPVSDVATYLLRLAEERTTGLRETWESLNLHRMIRLVIIIGGYLLIRPYLIKLTGKAQMEQHEREDREAKKRAEISPNELRGMRVTADIPDAEEVDTSTSTDWGNKARKRQRQALRKMLEAEEKRLEELQEDEDDKDIEEFLIKEDK